MKRVSARGCSPFERICNNFNIVDRIGLRERNFGGCKKNEAGKSKVDLIEFRGRRLI